MSNVNSPSLRSHAEEISTHTERNEPHLVLEASPRVRPHHETVKARRARRKLDPKNEAVEPFADRA